MDRTAFAIGQAALGMSAGGNAIEVGLGGLSLRCLAGPVTVAITGGNFRVTIDERQVPSWCVIHIKPNAELAIKPGRWGSWCYVAIAGTIDWPVWLGSRSTLVALPATGRPLTRDDELSISKTWHLSPTERELTIPVFCQPRSTINLVVGPQERFFEDNAIHNLFGQPYLLTANLNRMAIQLQGPKLPIAASLDMPSEGILRGSVQVPGGGDPYVLMADHQTTGGYPKIASMISADQDGFAQLRPHQRVQFQRVDVGYAVARARTRRKAIDQYLALLNGAARR